VDDDCNGTIDDGDVSCPCPLRRRSDHPYLFCEALTVRWDDAKAICQAYGYRLVVIDDPMENTWVWAMAESFSDNDFWIGLRRDGDAYRWVDGTVADDAILALFRNGQPNQNGDCIELDNSSNGMWNDEHCTDANRFVCEAPP
jgi:hypothetical protein